MIPRRDLFPIAYLGVSGLTSLYGGVTFSSDLHRTNNNPNPVAFIASTIIGFVGSIPFGIMWPISLPAIAYMKLKD
jgi:hypothetical protein